MVVSALQRTSYWEMISTFCKSMSHRRLSTTSYKVGITMLLLDFQRNVRLNINIVYQISRESSRLLASNFLESVSL